MPEPRRPEPCRPSAGGLQAGLSFHFADFEFDHLGLRFSRLGELLGFLPLILRNRELFFVDDLLRFAFLFGLFHPGLIHEHGIDGLLDFGIVIAHAVRDANAADRNAVLRKMGGQLLCQSENDVLFLRLTNRKIPAAEFTARTF